MMIIIGLFLVIVNCVSIKWDKLKVDPSVRGDYNQEQAYWTNGLNECDVQCQEIGGNVCGINQRQCCQEDQCVNKYGFQVCNALVQQFSCQLITQSPYKLKDVIDPQVFVQFKELYQDHLKIGH